MEKEFNLSEKIENLDGDGWGDWCKAEDIKEFIKRLKARLWELDEAPVLELCDVLEEIDKLLGEKFR